MPWQKGSRTCGAKREQKGSRTCGAKRISLPLPLLFSLSFLSLLLLFRFSFASLSLLFFLSFAYSGMVHSLLEAALGRKLITHRLYQPVY